MRIFLTNVESRTEQEEECDVDEETKENIIRYFSPFLHVNRYMNSYNYCGHRDLNWPYKGVQVRLSKYTFTVIVSLIALKNTYLIDTLYEGIVRPIIPLSQLFNLKP